jgi:hypothetical protein
VSEDKGVALNGRMKPLLMVMADSAGSRSGSTALARIVSLSVLGQPEAASAVSAKPNARR